MMSTTTLTAPISTEQINNTVYVGQGDLTTIQKAVNFAVAQGGEWRVAIPAGYTGSDNPLAVTGGSASVWIMEERNGMERPFIWFNGAYIYAALNQRAGIATPELNNMLFVGKTVDKFPTIQSAIDFSTSVPGIDFLIIVTNNYDGTEDIADLVNGSGTMQVIDQRDTTQQWAYWYWTGTNFKQAGITLEGDLLIDGDIYATNGNFSNNLSVSGNAGVNGNVGVGGDVTVQGHLAADTANFNACEVLNSPVRTFSNTPDAPGPSYPPAGIGVSTGTSWEPNSIEPAMLAYLSGAAFTGRVAVYGAVEPIDYSASNIQIEIGSNAPRITMVNSDATSFDWYSATNTMTWRHFDANGANPFTAMTLYNDGTLSIPGDFYARAIYAGGDISAGGALRFGAPMSRIFDNGNAAFFDYIHAGTTRGPLLLRQFAETGDPAGINSLAFDSDGNATFAGGVTAAKLHITSTGDVLPGATVDYLPNNTRLISVSAGGSAVHPDMSFISLSGDSSYYSEWLRYRGASNLSEFATNVQVDGYILAGGATISAPNLSHTNVTMGGYSGGQAAIQMVTTSAPADQRVWDVYADTSNALVFRAVGDTGVNATNWMSVFRSGTTVTSVWFNAPISPLRVNIQNSGTMYNSGPEGMLGIDSKIGYPILMNWFNGSGVLFGNGANVQVASISNSGVITGSAKNFAIPYPGDPNPENPTRALWHSCLEGPEYAVFYRGEGMTGEDGAVRIELPEYFEDLTRPTDRTVQVTQIGNSDDEFVMLMAGRVEQGSFKVRSSVPNTAFYWEVKAVRSDMEPLDVVRTVLKGEGVFGKMPTTGEAAEEPTTPPAKEPKGKNKK